MGLICTPYGYSGAAKVSGLGYQGIILADKPVAYWPLNETSGTVANDLSGNGYNGTYSGTFTLGQQGLPSGGYAAKLASGVITVGSPVITAANSITLEAWVNFNGVVSDSSSSAYAQLLNVGNANNGYGSGFENNSNTVECIYGGETFNTFSPAVTVPLTGWHHVAYVITSTGSSIIYIDGVQAGTNSNTAILAPSGYTTIGDVYGGGRSLTAIVCNCAVYPAALTAAQILNHYNAGIA